MSQLLRDSTMQEDNWFNNMQDPYDAINELQVLLANLIDNHNDLVQDYQKTVKEVRRCRIRLQELKERMDAMCSL